MPECTRETEGRRIEVESQGDIFECAISYGFEIHAFAKDFCESEFCARFVDGLSEFNHCFPDDALCIGGWIKYPDFPEKVGDWRIARRRTTSDICCVLPVRREEFRAKRY